MFASLLRRRELTRTAPVVEPRPTFKGGWGTHAVAAEDTCARRETGEARNETQEAAPREPEWQGQWKTLRYL